MICLFRIQLKHLLLGAFAVSLSLPGNARKESRWKLVMDFGAQASQNMHFSSPQESLFRRRPSLGPGIGISVAKDIGSGLFLTSGIGYINNSSGFQIKLPSAAGNASSVNIEKYNFRWNYSSLSFKLGLGKVWQLSLHPKYTVSLEAGIEITALPWLREDFDFEDLIEDSSNLLYHDSMTMRPQIFPVYYGNIVGIYRVSQNIGIGLFAGYSDAFRKISSGNYEAKDANKLSAGSFRLGFHHINLGARLQIDLGKNKSKEKGLNGQTDMDIPTTTKFKDTGSGFRLYQIQIAFRPLYQKPASISPHIERLTVSPSAIIPEMPIELSLSAELYQTRAIQSGIRLGFGRYINLVQHYTNPVHETSLTIPFEVNSVFAEPYANWPFIENNRREVFLGMGFRVAYNFVGGGGNTTETIFDSKSSEFSQVTFYFPEHNTLVPSVDLNLGYRIVRPKHRFSFAITYKKDISPIAKLPVSYIDMMRQDNSTLKLNASSWGLEVGYMLSLH